MDKTTGQKQERSIQEMLLEQPPAEWVQEMISHYQRTGYFQSKHLRKLLGDPTKCVVVGSDSSVSTFFSSLNQSLTLEK